MAMPDRASKTPPLTQTAPYPNRTLLGWKRIPIKELHYCPKRLVLNDEAGVFHRMDKIWHIEPKEGIVKPAVAARQRGEEVTCSPPHSNPPSPTHPPADTTPKV